MASESLATMAKEAELPRPPGRPRCPIAHRAILETAYELLEEVGFASMSVEGIASRAGVGKATIYRRWPNKASVVMDAFLAAMAPQIPFPDTGSAREDLRRQMRSLVEAMRGRHGRTIATLIGAGQADPELAEAFRTRVVALRRAEARQVLQRGMARGDFRSKFDPEVVLDALYAPLYFRLLVGHAPITAAFADAVVAVVLDKL